MRERRSVHGLHSTERNSKVLAENLFFWRGTLLLGKEKTSKICFMYSNRSLRKNSLIWHSSCKAGFCFCECFIFNKQSRTSKFLHEFLVQIVFARTCKLNNHFL